MKRLESSLLLVAPLAIVISGCSNGKNHSEADQEATTAEQASLAEATVSEIQDAPSITEKWASPAEFKVPESVCYDRERDVIYVSNINGNPTDKDDNGFISKLSKDGSIIELEWVTGMSAPKGMGIVGNKLFATDITRVVEIDIDKGEILNSYDAEGATFANDITVDDKGRVYISGMGSNKIWRIEEAQIKVWLESDELDGPNGLFFENGKLFVGGSFGKVLSIDVESKEISDHINDTGNIDGIVPDGQGNYIISDWKGTVHLISADKEKVQLLDLATDEINAADIDYIIKDNLLLVPTFFDNRVIAFEL